MWSHIATTQSGGGNRTLNMCDINIYQVVYMYKKNKRVLRRWGIYKLKIDYIYIRVPVAATKGSDRTVLPLVRFMYDVIY